MSFYVTGTLVALSGVIGFPLKQINRWENNRRLIAEEEESSSYEGEEDRADGMAQSDDSFKLKKMKRIPTNIPEVSEEEEEEDEEEGEEEEDDENNEILSGKIVGPSDIVTFS